MPLHLVWGNQSWCLYGYNLPYWLSAWSERSRVMPKMLWNSHIHLGKNEMRPSRASHYREKQLNFPQQVCDQTGIAHAYMLVYFLGHWVA